MDSRITLHVQHIADLEENPFADLINDKIDDKFEELLKTLSAKVKNAKVNGNAHAETPEV